MKLANKAFVIALTMLSLIVSMSAQTLRPADDDRNTAPTVGTGGPPGGPTGLFTIYDGQTLRRGEFTFSAAYSNYDRDPGNVDISEIPISFQIGLSDRLELFFNTDAYRGIKVNSPENLSSFALPNSRLNIANQFRTPGAIVAGTGAFNGFAVFRPPTGAFVQFPFIGGSAGSAGTIGTPTGGNNGFFGNTSASTFPGLGSPVGSILPGLVLQTANVVNTGGATITVPTVFTTAPSYLPDAPFINRTYGTSSFNTFTVGGKFRFTGPNNPYGIGIIPFYRFYGNKASFDDGGFNQLQRGASAGASGYNPFSSNRGDIGLIVFGDARLRKWMNVSANIGYIYNSSIRGEFAGNDDAILLDRGDEVIAGIGVDFPVNRYFQPILEFRSTQYVGGRTPNAFENSPIEGLAGARIYPTRYISIGGAYRHHFNQQDSDFIEDGTSFSTTSRVTGGTVTTRNFAGTIPGFRPSSDPHGFIIQFTAGRRNARRPTQIPNQFANVTNLTLSQTEVVTPCPSGFVPREGVACSDNMTVQVTTTAVDPENDVLTYNYTVTGGRIVGQGANVSWDLTGAAPGTYTITAGVDDGCGVCGQTQTRTITVRACDCVPVVVTPPCVCAEVSVTGPSGLVRAGETMTFTANTSGGNVATYNWSVDAGTIVSGQGTPSITVQTTAGQTGNVTATLKTTGDCPDCARTVSAVGSIETPREASLIDTIGAATDDDIKARFDALRVALSNDPTATAVIINYGTARQITTRERQIQKAIRFLSIDASRVTVLRGGDKGTGIETQVFIVPAGVTPPTPQ